MRRVIVPPPLVEPQPDRGASVVRIGGATMGTTWSAAFSHRAVCAEAASIAIQAAFDAVVAQMSPWEPTSELNRYNTSPAGSWVEASRDLLHVIDAALMVAAATDGAFDPTLGALVDLWGFGPRPFRGAPPTDEEITAAATACGWRRLERYGSRILQPGGLHLDLNGVAKGFGVEQATAALQALGVRNALVEAGGEFIGIGAKPDGTPWWVSLEAPPGSPAAEITLVALSGWAVATSADHRRAFLHDGERYGHTLDAATGAPVVFPPLSATVIHPRCALADAWATASLVLPAEEALEHADRGGFALVLVGPSSSRVSHWLETWSG